MVCTYSDCAHFKHFGVWAQCTHLLETDPACIVQASSFCSNHFILFALALFVGHWWFSVDLLSVFLLLWYEPSKVLWLIIAFQTERVTWHDRSFLCKLSLNLANEITLMRCEIWSNSKIIITEPVQKLRLY